MAAGDGSFCSLIHSQTETSVICSGVTGQNIFQKLSNTSKDVGLEMNALGPEYVIIKRGKLIHFILFYLWGSVKIQLKS